MIEGVAALAWFSVPLLLKPQLLQEFCIMALNVLESLI